MENLDDVKKLINYVEDIKEEKIVFYEYDIIVFNNEWTGKKKKVEEVARTETNKWLSLKRFNGNLALILVDTIFSLRANYENMLKNILIPFYQKFSKLSLYEFSQLNNYKLLRSTSKREYLESDHPFSYINRWKLFKEFVKFFLEEDESIHEIHNWAVNLDIKEFLKSNPNKYNFRGFGIAGIQYLRMQLGVNTIKPEFRIKKILKDLEVNLKNEYEIIQLFKLTSNALNMDMMELGFIFWYSYPLLK
ncbi:MAG: hypothetical protein CEE42_04820 [Promethearchaeota archaeon Loki_b31]|nr:MAG: hypothetical protein CEE42_04820 [Candidatus Lokiarchaeota archaeon Loki_b31]